ncbi:hypothetical protein [Streptomyces sp. W4I9-2]|nr:hypothetical protein [Streptomyces sp. W4I9-2]MDQ0694251.1 hypothetical protein [Streptomyces sp. W4I9-2]
MTDTAIHDDQTPEGRPATDTELAQFLGGMVTADGTSILDILNADQD